MLAAKEAMFTSWGAARTMIYNDRYAELLQDRHPASMGRPIDEVWHDIWDQLTPLVAAIDRGEAIEMDDIEFQLLRDGRRQEAHFEFSYTPLRDEAGAVAGLFCACRETTKDVVERRAEVRERAQLLQLFDQSPAFISATYGPDHVHGYVNQAHRDLFGDRALGRSVREAFPELDEAWLKTLNDVIETGIPAQFRATPIEIARRPDALPENLYFDLSYSPISEADGTRVGVLAQGFEVTDTIVRDRELNERNRLLERVMLAAPAAIYIDDRKKRRTIYANDGVTQLLGFTAEEIYGLSGKGLRALIHPEDRPALDATLARIDAAADGEISEGQYRMRRKDGTYLNFLDRVVALDRDAAGRVWQTLGVAVDVTQRDRAESALRESEARFRAAIDAVQGVIWTNTRDGEMVGEQAGWAALTGQTAREYDSYGWADAVHPDDARPTIDAWRAAVDAKQMFDFEHRVRRHDGEWRLFSVRAIPTLGADGEILEWVGVHTDITDARAADLALIESEEHYRNAAELNPQVAWDRDSRRHA